MGKYRDRRHYHRCRLRHHSNLYLLLVVEQTVNINHSSVTSAEDQDT